MLAMADPCTFWRMGQTWFAPSSGLRTRLGWVSMAGEVIDDEPRVQSPMRTMDDWIVSFVTAGSGLYRHADGTTVPITEGSVTFVPPGTPHWYGTSPDHTWREVFVVFNGPLFDLLAERGILGPPGPRAVVPPPSSATLRGIVRSQVQTMEAAEHQVLAVADWLLDAVPATGGPADSLLGAAARRLASDNTGSLDMRDVAADAGLSYDAFRHRFSLEFGQPPVAYRNAARLAAVATMLKLTDLTTREIARRFGYTDEFHLSRRFRARYGVPPSRYRRG
jgi:AraC-like DNA-binding protein/quercetin dioxygenase-like cupin family protein